MAVVCRPGLSTCLMSLCLLSGHRPDWRVLVLSRLLSTETVLRKTKGNKRRDGGHTRGDGSSSRSIGLGSRSGLVAWFNETPMPKPLNAAYES
jgi:hypothetical protein